MILPLVIAIEVRPARARRISLMSALTVI